MLQLLLLLWHYLLLLLRRGNAREYRSIRFLENTARGGRLLVHLNSIIISSLLLLLWLVAIGGITVLRRVCSAESSSIVVRDANVKTTS